MPFNPRPTRHFIFVSQCDPQLPLQHSLILHFSTCCKKWQEKNDLRLLPLRYKAKKPMEYAMKQRPWASQQESYQHTPAKTAEIQFTLYFVANVKFHIAAAQEAVNSAWKPSTPPVHRASKPVYIDPRDRRNGVHSPAAIAAAHSTAKQQCIDAHLIKSDKSDLSYTYEAIFAQNYLLFLSCAKCVRVPRECAPKSVSMCRVASRGAMS